LSLILFWMKYISSPVFHQDARKRSAALLRVAFVAID
jgi:hypothetical protein